MAADNAALAAEFAAGMSVRDIAAAHGLTRAKVRHILHQSGARFRPYRRPNAARDEAIVAAAREGTPDEDIAAAHGIRRVNRVREIVLREAPEVAREGAARKAAAREARKAAARKARETAAREAREARERRNEAIVADHAAGMLTRDIATAHGLLRHRVLAILREAGVRPATRREVADREAHEARERRNEAIVAAAREGKPDEDIAATHGLSVNRVHKIARTAGVKPIRRAAFERAARKAAIVEAARGGTPTEDIAAAHGLGFDNVCYILRTAGVKPIRRAPHARLAHNAAIIAEYVEGMPAKDSARAHGLPLERVRRIRIDREYSLRKRYGITCAEYAALMERQRGLCALCENPFEGYGRMGGAPQVDHDHALGARNPDAVRGIVHAACNTLIGFVECGRLQEGRTCYRSPSGARRDADADLRRTFRYLEQTKTE